MKLRSERSFLSLFGIPVRVLGRVSNVRSSRDARPRLNLVRLLLRVAELESQESVLSKLVFPALSLVRLAPSALRSFGNDRGGHSEPSKSRCGPHRIARIGSDSRLCEVVGLDHLHFALDRYRDITELFRSTSRSSRVATLLRGCRVQLENAGNLKNGEPESDAGSMFACQSLGHRFK